MISAFFTLLAKVTRRFMVVSTSCIVISVAMPVFAHEAPMRLVVVGEDSDNDSVPRSNEIYKRVVSQLQESLIREKITVIDEDMIAVKLGFSFESRRDKQELLQTLMIANETTDATVQSRLGMIFAIFPNIHDMGFTRKVTVRVRAQIYDLKTLSALSSFEVESPDAVTVPKKESMCNRLCVEEAVGEGEGLLAIADDSLHAREHAPDVGGHVFAEFVGVVMGFLVGRELLVVDVLAEAGADFEGRRKTGVREFDREGVVEFLDHAVAVGQELVPEFHKLVAALLLFGREDRENFGPLGGLHM